MTQQPGVGVVIARFQTTELHAGHRALLDEVSARHRHVLVVLGVARTYVPTFHNPLDVARREQMVLHHYPAAKIVTHRDCRSNARWSQLLDATIAAAYPKQTEFSLYGSRASFIPSYCGKYPCIELPETHDLSGTALRQDAVDHPALSREFRAGVVYTATTRPPLVFQTVDIAIVNGDRSQVLLGAKLEDEGLLRFVGGFVDPSDASLEMAAKREAFEETGGLELADFRYVGSTKVDDWRYRNTRDTIMTTLFAATHVFGAPKASDDMDGALTWHSIPDIEGKLVEEHRPLVKMLSVHAARERWW